MDMKNKALCPVIAFHLDTFVALRLFKELLKVLEIFSGSIGSPMSCGCVPVRCIPRHGRALLLPTFERDAVQGIACFKGKPHVKPHD